jgi:hypothetical protein
MLVAVVSVVAIQPAAPANADAGMPCPLTMILFCSALPGLPNLDHDVDLTTDPDGLDGARPNAPSPSGSAAVPSARGGSTAAPSAPSGSGDQPPAAASP